MLPNDIRVSVDVYDAPGSTGVQDFAGSADRTIFGGMKPLTTHTRALLGGDLSLTHLLILDDEATIGEGDKVIISSVQYRVSQVDTHGYGGHPHKQCVLSKVE